MSLTKVCSISDCPRPHKARGFCKMHWARWKKHGDPLHVDQIWHDDSARFATSYVVDPSGCWLWTGSVGNSGYGRFAVGMKTVSAHRWSYEHHVGPIPAGRVIDHLCGVKTCVNPQHLEPVTSRENTLRAPHAPATINAAKRHCIRGHQFTLANTYVTANGARRCRRCHADAGNARRAARAASCL